MKRYITLFLAVIFMISLTACGQSKEENSAGGEAGNQNNNASDVLQTELSAEDNSLAQGDTAETGSRILIAYFSVPEAVETTDAVAGASIVVKDSEKLGYVARLIQQTIGGDLFRIETVEEYPLDHDPLVDQAADEQDEDKRPELKNQVENFEQYEVVILGYPKMEYQNCCV